MKRTASRPALPDLEWSDFFAATLDRAWRRYDVLLERCREKLSPKQAHALRTATRRLLADADLAGTIVDADTAKLARALKRTLHATSDVRDADVHARRVRALLRDHPELNGFLHYLERRRTCAARAAKRDLKRHPVRKRLARLQRRLESGALPDEARSTVTDILRAAQTDAVNSAVAARRHPRRLHRARLDVKTLRYMIECLQPVLPRRCLAWRDALLEHQHLLGEIHDLEVLLAQLQDYAHRKANGHASLAEIQHALAADRRRRIADYRRCKLPEPPRELRDLVTPMR